MDDRCPNKTRWAKHELLLRRLGAGRHAIYEWLMISSLIAVLVLVFHMYRAVARATRAADHAVESLDIQNVRAYEHERVLNDIHSAIHEEGERTRAASRRAGK